jgi:SAM-dependent methyltransferase
MMRIGMPRAIDEKEADDLLAWERSASAARAGDQFLAHKLDKLQAASVLMARIDRYDAHFRRARSILELGGGSLWACYLIKSRYPNAVVMGTDIAPAAIDSHRNWASVFDTKIDGASACAAHATPFDSQQFDLIFTFQSAHHFGRHRRTLREIRRLLAPGGRCLYLHEPACREFIYPLAQRRVRRRPDVDEDVLVYPRLLRLAGECRLEERVFFDPDYKHRGPVETIYYFTLSKLPGLCQVLPCTVDIEFSTTDHRPMDERDRHDGS